MTSTARIFASSLREAPDWTSTEGVETLCKGVTTIIAFIRFPMRSWNPAARIVRRLPVGSWQFRHQLGTSKVKSLHKMAKAYLWDWSLVPHIGARFENLVAMHFLKISHYLQDREGYRAEVHYLRDRSGREVDFLMTWDGKPWIAVEVKLSETRIDPNLLYFRERLRIPWTYQIVMEGSRDFIEDGVRCLPARQFLSALV